MNIRRLLGWALILSAICLLLARFLPVSSVSQILAVIGTVLFIVGVPAIQLHQPEGLIGWIGILLLEIAALIAMAFMLGSDGGPALALTSAILGMLGRVIIGWLTIRQDHFPVWAGWAFLISGILNLLTGAVDLASASTVISVVAILLEVVALLGYGYRISSSRR